jgi:hypothetical protein
LPYLIKPVLSTPAGQETAEKKSFAPLLIISFNPLNISLKEKRRNDCFAPG